MRDHVDLASLQRILVIKLRHHGDVLLTSPVFSELKAFLPSCSIDALVYEDTAAMLQGHPSIDAIHTVDRRWKALGAFQRVGEEVGLVQRLRNRNYDLVLHLTEHTRGAWLTRLLKPKWSVAPKQPGRFWKGSFTYFVPRALAGGRHTVECNLDYLRRIGIRPGLAHRKLCLFPGAEAESKIDLILSESNLGTEQFVHVHPASRWAFKCWPASHFAMLIDSLQLQGWPVVLTCSPAANELELAGKVKQFMKAPVSLDLCGKLSLRELGALTSKARIFVGVDSAPMHMAAAVGTPAIALFGPSGDEWGPWGTPRRGNHLMIRNTSYRCSPCGLDGCGGGKVSDCLSDISVERVLAACIERL